jgi:hypothetical protein
VARWRRITGIALIALGALLAPVAILTGWAIGQLSDTDRFVATFAPLGADDEVQAFVAAQVTDAIEEQIDFEALIDPFFDGLTAGLGTVGTAAADAVKGFAVQGARQLVAGAVSRVVESDGFSAVWEQALRASHSTLVTVLSGESEVVSLADDGTIGIELGPIVERVKTSLVDGGLTFAAAIPEIDRTVPVATSQALVSARTAYGIAVAVGAWLPWLVFALVVGGLLLAGVGVRSIVLSSGGVAVGMVLLLVGIAIGRSVVVHEFAALGIPPTVGSLIIDRTVGDIVVAGVWVLVVVLVVALAVWLASRFQVMERVRRAYELSRARNTSSS